MIIIIIEKKNNITQKLRNEIKEEKNIKGEKEQEKWREREEWWINRCEVASNIMNRKPCIDFLWDLYLWIKENMITSPH